MFISRGESTRVNYPKYELLEDKQNHRKRIISDPFNESTRLGSFPVTPSEGESKSKQKSTSSKKMVYSEVKKESPPTRTQTQTQTHTQTKKDDDLISQMNQIPSNILNYYKSLKISPSLPLSEIQKKVRYVLFKYHPDKGGDEEQFKKLMKIGKVIIKDATLREKTKERADQWLNSSETKIQIPTPEETIDDNRIINDIEIAEGSRFNSANFNKVFENIRLESVADKGYNIVSGQGTREDISIEKIAKSEKDLHDKMKRYKQKALSKHKDLIIVKEIKAINDNGTLGYSNLGVEDVEDFGDGGELGYTGAGGTDFSKAHDDSWENLVEESMFPKKEEMTFQQMKKLRESEPTVISKEEAEQLQRLENQQRAEEDYRRLQTQAYQDQRAYEHYLKHSHKAIKHTSQT